MTKEKKFKVVFLFKSELNSGDGTMTFIVNAIDKINALAKAERLLTVSDLESYYDCEIIDLEE